MVYEILHYTYLVLLLRIILLIAIINFTWEYPLSSVVKKNMLLLFNPTGKLSNINIKKLIAIQEQPGFETITSHFRGGHLCT